jgi:hypothetical protein
MVLLADMVSVVVVLDWFALVLGEVVGAGIPATESGSPGIPKLSLLSLV